MDVDLCDTELRDAGVSTFANELNTDIKTYGIWSTLPSKLFNF